VRHAKRPLGSSSGALLLTALLLAAAVVAAPPLLVAARSAAGLDGVREPYTHLAFTDPAAATAGFPAGAAVSVEVGNETGAPAILRLVASDGAAWQAVLDVDLPDGALRAVDFTPPAGARRITVEIEGRGVLISAAVRP
jgi:hypothetical protein